MTNYNFEVDDQKAKILAAIMALVEEPYDQIIIEWVKSKLTDYYWKYSQYPGKDIGKRLLQTI